MSLPFAARFTHVDPVPRVLGEASAGSADPQEILPPDDWPRAGLERASSVQAPAGRARSRGGACSTPIALSFTGAGSREAAECSASWSDPTVRQSNRP